jgi:prepilin-type processing-associated H-X9-DG protein
LTTAALIVGYLGVILTVAGSVVIVMALEVARTSSCANNLRQIGAIFNMYANESRKGLYPMISPTAGQLMCRPEEVYPEYVTDPRILVCPGNSSGRSRRDVSDPGTMVNDASYFYLGYVITNDAEAEALAGMYKELISQGSSLPGDITVKVPSKYINQRSDVVPGDITVPSGKGNNGGDLIYRMRKGVERDVMKDETNPSVAQSQIPLVIERLGNHRSSGGHVLYLDGHVKYCRYPDEWPMTPKTMGMLRLMDGLGSQ